MLAIVVETMLNNVLQRLTYVKEHVVISIERADKSKSCNTGIARNFLNLGKKAIKVL